MSLEKEGRRKAKALDPRWLRVNSSYLLSVSSNTMATIEKDSWDIYEMRKIGRDVTFLLCGGSCIVVNFNQNQTGWISTNIYNHETLALSILNFSRWGACVLPRSRIERPMSIQKLWEECLLPRTSSDSTTLFHLWLSTVLQIICYHIILLAWCTESLLSKMKRYSLKKTLHDVSVYLVVFIFSLITDVGKIHIAMKHTAEYDDIFRSAGAIALPLLRTLHHSTDARFDRPFLVIELVMGDGRRIDDCRGRILDRRGRKRSQRGENDN